MPARPRAHLVFVLVCLTQIEPAGAEPISINRPVCSLPPLGEKAIHGAINPVRVLTAHRLRCLTRPIHRRDEFEFCSMPMGDGEENGPCLILVQAARRISSNMTSLIAVRSAPIRRA